MKSIHSRQNPRFKDALKLQSNRGRKRQERIAVFGVREVQRALAARLSIEDLFVCPELLAPADLDLLLLEAERRQLVCCELPRDMMEDLSYGDRADGVVAVARRPSAGLADLRFSPQPLVIVLEGIEKPGNFGAVVRSANGAGAEAVIAADATTDCFHPNSIRASLGTVFDTPVASAPALEVRDWLLANQFAVYAAVVGAPLLYSSADLTGRVAIVLGSEAEGLSSVWRSEPVRGIALPMQGVADSLNVSAAAAVLAYEAARQRRAPLESART